MDLVRYFFKGIAVLLLFVFSLHVSPGVWANESAAPTTTARAAILMDQYGQVLYAHNADASLPMASTTKIMTALVALEMADPAQRIRIPKEAVGIEGTSAYLMVDEEMTLLTLLYALMLQSANDAATAIALILSGSIEAFADKMNQKAAELGLSATHFTNPHGLDDEMHYTSASDLAKLTIAALKNPTFAQIVSTVRYQAPVEESETVRLFVNHNRLLREYEGCIGVKTGYTKRTGRCLVSAAKREGLLLVAVTLNDPNDWHDHKRLLDFGFSLCEPVTLTPESGITATIPVVGGTTTGLQCESREIVSVTLPQGSQPKLVLELPHFTYAGIPKDKQMGRAVWYLADSPIAETPLYAAENSTVKEPKPSIWTKICRFFARVGSYIINWFKK